MKKVQFIKINTKDKNAFQNELILGYVHFLKEWPEVIITHI